MGADSKVSRIQQLATKPVRSPLAKTERCPDGGARIQMPLKSTWFFKAPTSAKRTFEIDEIGVLVWDHCDGKTTLEQIIHAVAGKYRINLREAEVATLKFMEMLSSRRLIGVNT